MPFFRTARAFRKRVKFGGVRYRVGLEGAEVSIQGHPRLLSVLQPEVNGASHSPILTEIVSIKVRPVSFDLCKEIMVGAGVDLSPVTVVTYIDLVVRAFACQ